MKKMISLVLTIAMMLSLAIPASAADATIGSTESGSNSASASVKANYTPSSTATDEAKWGASATDLNSGSGTLEEAFEAAAASSSVKYIRLQKNVTTTSGYRITGGAFTLDLNGKTISSNVYVIVIGNRPDNSNSGIDVTFTDSSSGGKVETTSTSYEAIEVVCGKVTFTGGNYGRINMSDSGDAAPYAEVIIKDGSFTNANDAAIMNRGGKLTVNGGSFSGYLYDIYTTGTTTVKGGTFSTEIKQHIRYSGGKLDLSSYNGTTALTDLTVTNYMNEAVTVSDTTIKLPAGYAFYESTDTSKTTVTELAADTRYGIKSASGDEGGTTTTDEAKWGASATDLTTGSGTLEEAFEAAASSSVKYIRLQTNVTATSSYEILGGKFTLDLNGKTISSSGYTITIGDSPSNSNSGIDVTFTDTGSGGKVETTRSGYCAIMVKCGKVTFTGGEYIGMMSFCGRDVPYAEVIINDGSFKYDGEGRAVSNDGGKLTINGGSFSCSVGDIGISSATSVVTVNGGTFSESFDYSGGKLDLSGYPTTNTTGTTAITDLVVNIYATSSVTVGDTTIKLPAGYAFYESGDTSKTAVTELASHHTYAIKSTSGSTTDEATITGVTVTIDGTEYSSTNATATNPAKITSATAGITYTIKGTDLDKLPGTFKLLSARGLGIDQELWTVSQNGTSATFTLSENMISAYFSGMTTAFELQYTLDGSTWVNTGVYYVYDSGTTEAAVITGLSVKVGAATYTSGTVTLTPTSGDVTLIVTGTDLKNTTTNNKVLYAQSLSLIVHPMYGWTVNDAGTEASAVLSLSWFESCTTAFELKYTNDNSNYTDSGVYILYQTTTTSVDITWGSMSFTYSDEQVDGADKGWTCETGANTVTVENRGTASVKADVSFTKSTTAENITNVSGSFDKSTATLAANASETFALTLSGKPGGALDKATIGSVTVTISKASS